MSLAHVALELAGLGVLALAAWYGTLVELLVGVVKLMGVELHLVAKPLATYLAGVVFKTFHVAAAVL